MDVFKPKTPVQPTNNQQPNQQSQPSVGNTSNNNPSGITDGQANPKGNPANDTQQVENPLDQFKGMFDNTNTNTERAPSFILPQDKINDVASKLNFTQSVPPELMQKAMSGDAQAMMDVMNVVGQQAYARSLEHTTTLSDNYMNSRLDFEGKSLGSKVKEHLTSAELSTKTPGFDNPVVKAQLSSTAKELARMYPDATPAEIAQKARDYITTLANSINPTNTEAAEQAKASETNWDDYF